MKIKATWRGFADIERNLEKLHKKIERGGMRKALTLASKPLINATRSEARKIEATGNLRKSIGHKSKTRKGVVSVYVGPRRRYKSGGKKDDPSRIVHLIESGFRHKGGQRVQGTKFMKSGFNMAEKEARSIYVRNIRSEVLKAAKKLS